MIKTVIILFLAVGTLSLRMALSDQHLADNHSELEGNGTALSAFQMQFGNMRGYFANIDNQLTRQNRTRYSNFTAQLNQFKKSIEALQDALVHQNMTIVLNKPQCPPLSETAQATYIKAKVYKTQEQSQKVDDYISKNCSKNECDFAKGNLTIIQKYMKFYGNYVNRTLDRKFCPDQTGNSQKQEEVKGVAPIQAGHVTKSTVNRGNGTKQTYVEPSNNTNSSSESVKNQTSVQQQNQQSNQQNKTTTNTQSQSQSAAEPQCPQDKIYDLKQKKCVDINPFCKKGFAFVAKLKKCIAYEQLCNRDQYYDHQAQDCYARSMLCKEEEQYDLNKHKCVHINETCPESKHFNHKLQTCIETVKCKEGQVLNQEYDMCEKKEIYCNSDQVFDYKQQKCIHHDFMTSPYISKLIYEGDFKEYVKQFKEAKKSDKALTTCVQEAPFYQRSIRDCIACPPETPYFNISKDECVKCKFNEYFDAYRHNCVNEKIQYTAPDSVFRMGL